MPNFFTQIGDSITRAQDNIQADIDQTFGVEGSRKKKNEADRRAWEAQQAQAQAQPVYVQAQPQGQPVYVQAPMQAQPPQVYVAQPAVVQPNQPRVVGNVGNHGSRAERDAKAHAAHQAVLAQQTARAQQPQVVYVQQQPAYVQGQPGQPVYVQQQVVAPAQARPIANAQPVRRKGYFEKLGDDLSQAQHKFDASVNRALGVKTADEREAERQANARAHAAQGTVLQRLTPQQMAAQQAQNGQNGQQIVYVQQQPGPQGTLSPAQQIRQANAQQQQPVYAQQGQPVYVQGAPQPVYYAEAPPPAYPQQGQQQPPQNPDAFYPVVKPQ